MNFQEFIKKVTGGSALSTMLPALSFGNSDSHSGFVSANSRITPDFIPDVDVELTAVQIELQVLSGTKTITTSTDSGFLARVHIRKNSVFTHE